MGFDSVQIRVIMRNLPMNSIRLLYRSVCNNPFLVGFVCLLILLFKSFPFLVSLLVSASPILVCTALLLGTLLSFGHSSIPEIRNIEYTVSENATVVERDSSFTVERVSEQASFVEKKGCEMGNAFDSAVSDALSVDGKLVDLVLEKKVEINEENLETEGMANDVNLEMVTDKSPADSEEADVGNVKSSDDESDRAESSSPDASMADIFPMLDELHPLLDEDAPHPTHMSHDDSDGVSHYDMTESDDDFENKGEEVDGDDDEEDEEEEEEEEEEATLGNNGFASSSPITWTEDDHRNVIDIGTSEIERNKRLESLIARMKARKTLDMGSADLTFNVPPVATTRRNPFDDAFNDLGLPPVPGSAPSVILPRQNPFDVPDDSYYGTGLPPIPGSAPANILPGQNPFDIPFDSGEEKPDDSFQENFSSQERQDISWRPYFDHMEDQTLNKEGDPQFGQKEVHSTHTNA